MQKFREKMIAEGKKQFTIYIDSDAQESLEIMKEGLLKKLSKDQMSLSELIQEILADYINQMHTNGALESENEELKEKHNKIEDLAHKLLDRYKYIEKKNATLETRIKDLEDR